MLDSAVERSESAACIQTDPPPWASLRPGPPRPPGQSREPSWAPCAEGSPFTPLPVCPPLPKTPPVTDTHRSKRHWKDLRNSKEEPAQANKRTALQRRDDVKMVVRRILKETSESLAKDQSEREKRLLKIKFNSEFKNSTDDLKNRIETAEKWKQRPRRSNENAYSWWKVKTKEYYKLNDHEIITSDHERYIWETQRSENRISKGEERRNNNYFLSKTEEGEKLRKCLGDKYSKVLHSH